MIVIEKIFSPRHLLLSKKPRRSSKMQPMSSNPPPRSFSVLLTGAPEEGACLISRPRLGRGEERVLKLEIVAQRPK